MRPPAMGLARKLPEAADGDHTVIYACFPVGNNHGWGVLGKHVTLELAKLADTRLLLPPDQRQDIGDEIDVCLLRSLLPRPDELKQFSNGKWTLRDPVIQVASGSDLGPFLENV